MKLAGLFVDPKGITLLWNWTFWVEKVVLGLSSYFTWESDFSFSSSFGFSPLAIGLFLTEQDEWEKRVESGFGSNETNGHLTTERIISAKGTSACSLKGLFEKLATRTRVSPSLGITKVRAKLISDLPLSSLLSLKIPEVPVLCSNPFSNLASIICSVAASTRISLHRKFLQTPGVTLQDLIGSSGVIMSLKFNVLKKILSQVWGRGIGPVQTMNTSKGKLTSVSFRSVNSFPFTVVRVPVTFMSFDSNPLFLYVPSFKTLPVALVSSNIQFTLWFTIPMQ